MIIEQLESGLSMLSIQHKRTRARAPLRLGFAGGGTDLSPFCDEHGGAVLNMTINRHAYVFIESNSSNEVNFHALDLGVKENISPLQVSNASLRLGLHQGVYNRMMTEFNESVPLPFNILTTVDAPAGSGLGSSSALVVALVEAFRAHLDLPLGSYDVARLAWDIERNDLGLAGGRQDQYAAAFGGINFMEFLPGERVIVNPMRLKRSVIEEIDASLVICFSGQSRASHDIIMQQKSALESGQSSALVAMHQLKEDAIEMKTALQTGDIREAANILDRSWRFKKQTAVGVSNAHVDRLYQAGKGHGALAGKVSGAGGGGFIMFLAQPENRQNVIAALEAEGCDVDAVSLTEGGVVSWSAPH